MPFARAASAFAALATTTTAVRLSLHVLAASVWVGGQLTVAGLLGTARGLGESASKLVARAFGRLQWPAYAALLATGVWNVVANHLSAQGSEWNAVLGAKIAVVLIAGLAAYLHQRSRSRAGLAAFGAISALASLSALVLGVLLAG